MTDEYRRWRAASSDLPDRSAAGAFPDTGDSCVPTGTDSRAHAGQLAARGSTGTGTRADAGLLAACVPTGTDIRAGAGQLAGRPGTDRGADARQRAGVVR